MCEIVRLLPYVCLAKGSRVERSVNGKAIGFHNVRDMNDRGYFVQHARCSHARSTGTGTNTGTHRLGRERSSLFHFFQNEQPWFLILAFPLPPWLSLVVNVSCRQCPALLLDILERGNLDDSPSLLAFTVLSNRGNLDVWS
jgi:hypothetical protein